jgi:hypothetical protein
MSRGLAGGRLMLPPNVHDLSGFGPGKNAGEWSRATQLRCRHSSGARKGLSRMLGAEVRLVARMQQLIGPASHGETLSAESAPLH